MAEDRCGNCRHGKMIAEDLSKRVCKGAPPTPVLLQGAVRFLWPVVMASDEACGCYGPRAAAVAGTIASTTDPGDITIVHPDGTHTGPVPITKGRPQLLRD